MRLSIKCLVYCFLLNTLSWSASFKSLEQQGLKAYQQNDYRTAEVKWKKAKIKQPDNASIYFNLGHAQYRLQKYSQAVDNYKEVLKLNDTTLYALAKYNMGNALFKQAEANQLGKQEAQSQALQEYKKAMKSYQESYQLDTNYNPTLKNLELTSHRIEKLKQIQKELENQENQEQPPPSEQAKKAFQQAMQLVAQNKFVEAGETLKKVILVDHTAGKYREEFQRIQKILQVLGK